MSASDFDNMAKGQRVRQQLADAGFDVTDEGVARARQRLAELDAVWTLERRRALRDQRRQRARERAGRGGRVSGYRFILDTSAVLTYDGSPTAIDVGGLIAGASAEHGHHRRRDPQATWPASSRPLGRPAGGAPSICPAASR